MKRVLRFILNLGYYFIELVVFLFIVLALYLGMVIPLDLPKIDNKTVLEKTRTIEGVDKYRLDENWAVKSNEQIWEVYIEGEPFERGVAYGKLLEEPVQIQEDFFIDQIEKLVPSSTYRFFLTVMIGFFNRDITEYIPEEYLAEIYGVSFSFSDGYDNLAPKYYRILNYHAAHDIGHALDDYNMVGCTSFSVRDGMSEDSSLLVGRNFDFYMGDEFSENKVLTFVNPNKGFKFAMYSWAGLMGAVSGMNEKGIAVTINASKSELPSKTKTPVTLVTREILQYASTIEEAIEIAKKRSLFVSETFMVSSAYDNKTVLIEKSPSTMDVYDNELEIVYCTNHYQSEKFEQDEINIGNIKNSDSKYRYDRLKELVKEDLPLNTQEVVDILRNQKGLQDANLGYGNPKAINQLIAHHSIVFKPNKLQMWVSTDPHQLGKFVCYDLAEVFKTGGHRDLNKPLIIDSLTIAEDPFLHSDAFTKFTYFKEVKKKLFDHIMIGIEYDLTADGLDKFIDANPENYVTYMLLGEYYLDLQKNELGKKYFEIALTKDIASIDEKNKINSLLDECKSRLESN